MAQQQKAQVLVVILDLNEEAWKLSIQPFDKMVEALLAFLNAFMMLHQANKVAVIVADSNVCEMIYPPKSPDVSVGLVPNVMESLARILKRHEAAKPEKSEPRLSSAMAVALCYLNSVVSTDVHVEPRILVVQASSDAASQYIAVMNSIFAAERKEAYIDACVFADQDSTFLQQACHITKGVYWRVPRKDTSLLQYFLTVFLPGKATRPILQLPQPDKIELQAMCFDTKSVVELAHVCSVCLSIFSQPMPECATCGAKFKSATNKHLQLASK